MKELQRKYTKNGLAARWTALQMLSLILRNKKTISEAKFHKTIYFTTLSSQEQARTLSILDSIFRNLSSLDSLIFDLVRRNTNFDIINILRIATAEVFLDKIAPHAAVNCAVQLTKLNKKTHRYVKLVNAICRKIVSISESGLLLSGPKLNKDMYSELTRIYGKAVSQKIRVALYQLPPLDITIKSKKSQKQLCEALNAKILPTGSLRIKKSSQISSLPGFDSGDWWVQDCASALPARFLENVSDSFVLDVCAAPGGKTMQLASYGAKVTAVEISKIRARLLYDNLARTGLKATVVEQSILDYNPRKKFDFILVDPPCTSTGTMRRNSELQHLSPISRMPALVRKQKQILRKSMNLLKKGGKLVYCTCSLLPEEGENVIEDIIKNTSGWKQIVPKIEKLGLDPKWLDKKGGLRLRPDFWSNLGGMDGFYVAVLTN